MGVADLRESFNRVASPAFTCQKAFLYYETFQDVQWQRMRFTGLSAAGVPFDVHSNRARSQENMMNLAAATAQNLVDNPPPVEPA